MLLRVLNFERISADDDTDATWIIPSSSYPTSSRLEEALQHLTRHETTPIELPDGKSAEDFLHVKRKAATSRARRAEFDDEDDDATSAINTENEDDEPLFPAGGPTARPSDPSDEDLNKQHRRRRRLAKSGEIDDADAEAARAQRAHARQRAEASKRHKIKSDLFVHESDEEDDAERDDAFFALEESRRRGFGRQVDAVLGKRGSPVEDDDADEGRREQTAGMLDDADTVSDVQVPRKKSRKKGPSGSNNDDTVDASNDDMRTITSAFDEENDVTMLSDTSTVSSHRSGGRSNPRSVNSKRYRNRSSRNTVGDAGSPTILRNDLSATAIEVSNNKKDDDHNHKNNYDSDTTANSDSNLEDTTPLSSQGAEDYGQKQHLPEGRNKNGVLTDIENEKDNHDNSPLPGKGGSILKRNVRAGFIIDSDSE